MVLSVEDDPTGFLETLGGKVSCDVERCWDDVFAAAVEGRGFRLTGDSMDTGLAVVKVEKEGIDMPSEGLARLWPEAALVDGRRSDWEGRLSGSPERSIGSTASRCMSITIRVERARERCRKEQSSRLEDAEQIEAGHDGLTVHGGRKESWDGRGGVDGDGVDGVWAWWSGS